jgi:hypothetical protein
LREAFLLQMNEFDRFLEQELRLMLDPVVEVQPPARGERLRRLPEPTLALTPAVEPVPVTVPVTTVSQL